MTKEQLRMTNNELEARVIELETKLANEKAVSNALEAEVDELTGQTHEWQERFESLEHEIKAEADARPAIPFAEWYYTVHRTPGGNPDLRVLEATKHDRIIA